MSVESPVADSLPTAPDNQSPPAPRTPWWQFSLRTLLIASALVAIFFGLWIVPAERQRAAVADLKQYGAEIIYRTTWFGEKLDTWIAKGIPRDYLSSPRAIKWSESVAKRITKEGIDCLAQFTSVESLDISC